MKQALTLPITLTLFLFITLGSCHQAADTPIRKMIARADTLLAHDSATAAYEFLGLC